MSFIACSQLLVRCSQLLTINRQPQKTALKLLAEYESIDGILNNLDILPKSVKSKIESDLVSLLCYFKTKKSRYACHF